MSEKPNPKQEKPEADKHVEKASKKPATEIGGREGPEPTRYGDWENKGIISDF
jgi:hypothetical protein